MREVILRIYRVLVMTFVKENAISGPISHD